MDDAKIRAAVIAEWAKVYPEDQQPIVVTVVIDKAFGGALTAIRSKEADGTPNEELVYVFPDYNAKIFRTTEELAAFLQNKSRVLFVDILSDPGFIAAFVFVVLIVIVFFIGFRPENAYNKEAFIALTSVLGAAAGFFFGTKRQQS
jgi:hypothetical protein